MKIRLQRGIVVRCVRVIATLGIEAERRVELSLVRWAADRLKARRVATTEVLLSMDGLLPGRPVVLARSLLRNCAYLGLLELEARPGDLRVKAVTDEGRAALERGTVFVPQQGSWELYFSDDPLLPHPLLRIEPHKEPSAHQEVGDRRERRRRPQRPMVQVPALLRELVGETLELSAASREIRSIRLDEIERLGEEVDAGAHLRVELSCQEDQQTAGHLVGSLAGTEVKSDWEQEDLSFDLVWRTLLSGVSALTAWDGERRRLRRTFGQTDAGARRSFRDALRFPSPRLGEYGAFDGTVIGDVPIGPASEVDAQHWYDYLLLDGVQGYEAPVAFGARAEALRGRFSGHAPVAPSSSELARRLREDARGGVLPRAYFYLQAPLDLPSPASQEVVP